MFFILNSPIEQFNLLLTSKFGISNLNLFFSILIVFIYLLFFFVKVINNSFIINSFMYISNNVFIKENIISLKCIIFSFIPTKYQMIIENFFFEFLNSFKALINNNNNLYIFFNILFTNILFVLLANLIGLLPYSFTLTAQIFITFNISILMFLTFNFAGYIKHHIYLIALVVPHGIHISLHFLLLPIEIISYVFRPISLSIRLFANIMAGHTLLKVICGFIYKFFAANLPLILTLIPFSIVTILFFLESFVALIQSYVFFILLSLFLKDIISLSH